METLSRDYTRGREGRGGEGGKIKGVKGWTELTKAWPVAERCKREVGPCVCFDRPLVGSAGGLPDLDSFDRSIAANLIIYQ